MGLSAVAEAERSFDMEDGERDGDEGWRAATWPDAFDRNFARGDLLGRGSFGTVYRCVERASGDDEYAVKVIPKTREGADPARILMRIREEVRSPQPGAAVLQQLDCKFHKGRTGICRKVQSLGDSEASPTRAGGHAAATADAPRDYQAARRL